MNNDLISREALRKTIEKLNSVYMENKDHFYTEVLFAIDNAPTVNLEKQSFIQGYKEGCEEGKRCYERPQGERR